MSTPVAKWKKNYQVIMFKLKGHETWRISMDYKLTGVKNVTEKKVIVIDCITGEVTVPKGEK